MACDSAAGSAHTAMRPSIWRQADSGASATPSPPPPAPAGRHFRHALRHIGHEAFAGAGLGQPARIGRGVLAQHHEGFPRQVGQRQPLAARQAMPGRQRHRHRIRPQRLRLQLLVVDPRARDAEVDAMPAQLDLRRRAHLVQQHRHLRVRAPVARDQRRRRPHEVRSRQADLDAAGQALVHRLRAHGRVLEPPQRDAHVVQEGLAGLGQRDAAIVAVEQLHAQLALQLRDLQAERRLGDVQRRRAVKFSSSASTAK